MAGATNTKVYGEEWQIRLQEELDEPTKFKEICKVIFTNTKVLHNPFLTEASVQSGTRACPYTHQAVVETDESVDINTFKILPQIIDRADLAQSTYSGQMALATRQAILLNESIEEAVYDDHGNMTDFGTSDIGGGGSSTSQITVSVTNVDDIIRGLGKTIREAEGESLWERNGAFFVWRPADFEVLEAYMQANGFASADRALVRGIGMRIDYMGFTHYSSNLLAANHVFAGVKNAATVGILRATYGQVMVNTKDPGDVSGVSVVSRVDFKEKIWNKTKPVVFDINVV